jgi:hypothetical protein
MAEDRLSRKEIFDLYEQGKHRRYSLLFSVNGGAFATGSLLLGGDGQSSVVLGGLTVGMLALAMIVFSAALCADIWMFGGKMRALDEGLGEPTSKLFGAGGRIVLLLLSTFLVLAWAIAGFVSSPIVDG